MALPGYHGKIRASNERAKRFAAIEASIIPPEAPDRVKLGPRTLRFEQRLKHAGLVFPQESNVPRNRIALTTMLERTHGPIRTADVLHRDFAHFTRLCTAAKDEAEVTAILLSQLPSHDYHTRGPHEVFDHICTHQPLSRQITKAQPDLFDGEVWPDMPFAIPRTLGEYIQCTSRERDSLFVPNFSIEIKGPSGQADVCKRQAFHNGALGARAMHKLRQYGGLDGDALFDRNAYAITVIFEASTVLTIYSVHIERRQRALTRRSTLDTSSGDALAYHISELGSFHLRGNAAGFQQGLSALLNARRWAKQQRKSAIAAVSRARRGPNAARYRSVRMSLP